MRAGSNTPGRELLIVATENHSHNSALVQVTNIKHTLDKQEK